MAIKKHAFRRRDASPTKSSFLSKKGNRPRAASLRQDLDLTLKALEQVAIASTTGRVRRKNLIARFTAAGLKTPPNLHHTHPSPRVRRAQKNNREAKKLEEKESGMIGMYESSGVEASKNALLVKRRVRKESRRGRNSQRKSKRRK